MSHPAERWAKFARRVLHDAWRHAEPAPELAGYAADMMKADKPTLEMGERAIFQTLCWAAQAFSWSDAERRAWLSPRLEAFAGFVLRVCDGQAPAPPPAPSAPPANAYYLDKDD